MPIYSAPITINSTPARYNVLYQKQSLTDNVGALKIAGRAMWNLGVNKHVPRAVNTLGEIGHFLSKHENTAIDDIKIYDLDKGPNLFDLASTPKTVHFPKTKDYYKIYQCFDKYNLWIPAYRNKGHKLVQLKAKNDQEAKQKIFQILNSDTARAKLEAQAANPLYLQMPFFPAQTIHFKEHKMVGDFKEHGFDRVGNHHNNEAFDTHIGAVDQKQLAYYLPDKHFKHYSNRIDNAISVKDDMFKKLHASSTFADAGAEIDEIVGNIILQTYAGKKLEPEFVAQMTRKIKDDYIYNTYGYHSRGAKINQSAFPIFGILSKIQPGKSGSRFIGANDPLSGGRFWHNHAPSHQELVKALYQPQADGTAKFLYDRDPDAFMQLADKLVITKPDRQYMMAYGRKAIGARIAINFVQDEISKIKLDDPALSAKENEKNKIKHLDLTRFQSKIFASLGDLRETFRKSCVGMHAYAQAVGNEVIPDIKSDKDFDRVTTNIPSETGFINSIHKGLDDYVEDYAYFDAFWGWQGREYVGRALFDLFKKDLFDKEIDDTIVDNAVSIVAGVVDRSSRRMKSFSEFYLKDANLGANIKTAYDRAKRLDLAGLSEVIRVQKSNTNEFFEGRKSYQRTNVKRMILQNQGVSHNKEIWPTFSLKYQGNQRGRFNANFITHCVAWRKAEKTAGDLKPLLIDIARFMKAHQKSMRMQNIEPNHDYQKNDSVFKTPEMIALNSYINKAANQLADDYLEKNKNVFNSTKQNNELRVLHKQVKTEYTNVLNVIVNVVAMISHMDEAKALNLGDANSFQPELETEDKV